LQPAELERVRLHVNRLPEPAERPRLHPQDWRGAVRDPAARNLTQAIREACLREARELVHGTCVALGRRGALLRALENGSDRFAGIAGLS
jgi:hypothetical protein